MSKGNSLKILSTTLILGTLVSIGSRPAVAQGGTATIEGIVTDPSGAAVANAMVNVTNTDTGFTQSVVTGTQGRFDVPQVPIGQYSVTITAPGFQTEVRSGITLTVGAQTALNIALKVGQAQQTVTVQGQVTQVENTQTSIDTLVEPTQMRELPLNGRDFEQLLTLSPGVVTQHATGGSFYGTQANYSVSGGRPEGQAFLLDDTNVQDFWMHGTGSGALGTSLGIDAIAEFQMLTNTYSAQYGGNGAVINAVTRSGTNNFHGSAYEFLRNDALDSRNYFDKPNTIPPFRRNQFGGTLGGPIKKDKFFFFANYEGVRQVFGQSFIAFVPDASSRSGPIAPNVAATLALYPLPTSEVGGGIGQITTQGNQVGSENYGVTRVDYNFSDRDSAFVRYGVDQAQILVPNGGSNILLWPATNTTFNQYLTLEERHTFSANIINLARFSYVRPNEIQKTTGETPALQFFSTSPQNGTVSVTGLSPIGAAATLPSTEIQNRFDYGDDVVWTHGAHNFTFGIAVERIQDNTNAPFQIGGSWSFNSIPQFLQKGVATLVTAPLPGLDNAAGYLRELIVSPYFEDSWKVSPKLTINMGLRYEPTINPDEHHHEMEALVQTPLGIDGKINQGPFAFQPVPAAFARNPSLNNFDPRFGFAFDPYPDHKTVIRGGFGIFHDIIEARTILPGYWLNPPYAIGLVLNPVYGPNPVVGSSPISQGQGIAYQSSSTPYQMQFNLNIQREILPNTIMTLGYVGSVGRHLIMGNDLNAQVNTGTAANPILGSAPANPCPPVPTPGCSDIATPHVRLQPTGVEAIPGNIYSNLSSLSNKFPSANSNYNSLQASMNRRFNNNLQFQINYTYSKSMDINSITYGLESTGAGGQNLNNPYDPKQDYGRSTFDQTQLFEASGLYQLPFKSNFFVQGWQFSGILNVGTGNPFSVFDGFDRAGLSSVSGGERPNLVPGCSSNPKIGKVNEWYNPSCFALQPAGTLGNLGRNTLIGPGFSDLDFALMKNTTVPRISEAFAVQFRVEAFDALNHPNFNFPNNGNGIFQSSGILNTTAPKITSTNGNEVIGGAQRVIQFGLKILF